MKTPAYRRRKHNRLAVVCISVVVAMLMLVVTIDGMRLTSKHEKYLAEEASLKADIAEEERRSVELSEFEKYTKTKRYAEEVAEDKLGLVHDDEIIFKPDDTD